MVNLQISHVLNVDHSHIVPTLTANYVSYLTPSIDYLTISIIFIIKQMEEDDRSKIYMNPSGLI